MAPSWSRRALGGLALAGSVLLAPADAEAAEPAGITLSYDAPPGCPSRTDLVDELRARVDASWLRGTDARKFDAKITRHEGGGYSGRLEIAQPGRAPKIRVIDAPTCGAVVTSIAVFLALVLDPASEDAPSPPPPPSVERKEPDARAPPPPPPRNAEPTAPRPPRSIWTWRAGYDATYLHAGDGAWGGRVHADLARRREDQRLAPALRVSWGFSDFSTFPERGGEAKFRLKTARIEGCVRIDLAPFVADGCAGFDVGTLSASTPTLPASLARTVQWIAAAALIRAAWSITSWLSASAELSVLVPFERTSFALDNPRRHVYRAPALLVGGAAGLGVTARFR